MEKRYLVVRTVQEYYEVIATSAKKAKNMPTEDPHKVIVVKTTAYLSKPTIN